MKKYDSTDDLRTWCIEVQQRRQQILEYQAINRGVGGPYPDKIIPLEALFNAVLEMKDNEIKDLEEEAKVFEKTVNKL